LAGLGSRESYVCRQVGTGRGKHLREAGEKICMRGSVIIFVREGCSDAQTWVRKSEEFKTTLGGWWPMTSSDWRDAEYGVEGGPELGLQFPDRMMGSVGLYRALDTS
jgi:hypothetical protein